VIADVQLAYAYALQAHLPRCARVGDAAGLALTDCIQLLEDAVQGQAPVAVVAEQIDALDEEIVFIEVCLDAR
jgi:hypothetical protein